MPTPAERSALLFVAAVAALGLGVRGCRAVRPAGAPRVEDRAALAQQLAAVDSAIAAGGRRPARAPRGSSPPGSARPPASLAPPAPPRAAPKPPGIAPAPAEPVDPDVASAPELDRLPGIGPSLAARIVADRDSLGPFGSLDGLQRVRGIGPALAAKLAPHVVFSGRSPPKGSGAGHRY